MKVNSYIYTFEYSVVDMGQRRSATLCFDMRVTNKDKAEDIYIFLTNAATASVKESLKKENLTLQHGITITMVSLVNTKSV